MLENEDVTLKSSFHRSFQLLLNLWAEHWQNSAKTYAEKTSYFYKKQEIIYPLQFGFWRKHSTTHAMIHLTNKMRHEIHNYACRIVVDFQEFFEKVKHHVSISCTIKKPKILWCQRNFK